MHTFIKSNLYRLMDASPIVNTNLKHAMESLTLTKKINSRTLHTIIHLKYTNIIFIPDMFQHCHYVIFSRMSKTVTISNTNKT